MHNDLYSEAAVRAAQIDAARKMDSDTAPVTSHRARQVRPAAAPKGHEAFLKALEASGATVCVVALKGDQLIGTLRHSDKYTLTLRVAHNGGTRDEVLFKHGLLKFYSLTPRVKAEQS